MGITSMKDTYLSILQQYWGYKEFRGIQRNIIESICSGKDTLGLMPTGGGKSITFQVPAIVMAGTCIVFTPLIALMKDQVDALIKRGIRAAAIHSGLSHNEIVKILDTAVWGGYKILYISPERLNSELFVTKLKKMKVSFITVDEAHCICYWGYDFRPAYMQIKRVRELKPEVPILALTASATPEAVEDIQQQLAFRARNVFRMSFERKNLCYRVLQTSLREKAVTQLLEEVPGPAIIYTRNRDKCHFICRDLCQMGFKTTYYHAGLEECVKNERQTKWMADEYRIMVATNAFGMGIDKPDVRLVIHMDLPDSIEAYYQEAGRAGRDGKRSYAVIPMDGKELQQFRTRGSLSFPEEEYVKDIYEKMCFYLQMAVGDGLHVTREFKLEEFCRTFHTHPAKTMSALTLLGYAGYIKMADEDDSCSRLLILATRHELYSVIDKEKEPIINCILRHYAGVFAEYCYIEELFIAQQTGLSPDTIYNTLKHLSRARIIEYVPKKRVARITFTQRRVERNDIVLPRSVYEERKQKHEARMKAMEAYVTESTACRSKMLLDYFGEPNAAECGQCDTCEAKDADSIGRNEEQRIRDDIMSQLREGPAMVFDLKHKQWEKKKYDNVLLEMCRSEQLIIEGAKIRIKE